ncbi:MAG: hypothetical protein U0836_16405 [Pirellulales bacterium]
MKLDQVVPWGRTGNEYERMFALDAGDLPRAILGVADGPASFNAEWSARGGRVVSVDPLYVFDAGQIEARFEAVLPRVMEATLATVDAFVWDEMSSVEELERRRRKALSTFLADYEAGRWDGRYLAAGLPHLPLASNRFDLALCSHYLFTYSDLLDADAHLAAIVEMARVAREVRVFPLVDMFAGGPSRHLTTVLERLPAAGLTARIERVPYEFQRGANEMLVVNRLVAAAD